MASEPQLAPQAEMEPRRDVDAMTPVADLATDVQPFPLQPTGTSPADIQRAAHTLSNGAMRHPAAWMHRAAVMRKVQQGLGNHFAQTMLRSGPTLVEKTQAQQNETEKEAARKKKAEGDALHAAAENAATATKDHGDARQHDRSLPAVHSGGMGLHAPAVEAAHETQAAVEPSAGAEGAPLATEVAITDEQASAAVRAEWAQQAPDIPLFEPLVIPFAAPLAINLQPPAKPDPSEQNPPNQLDAVREATASYARFNQEAGRDHREVIGCANDIRREEITQARESVFRADTILSGSVDSIIQTVESSRTLIMVAAENAMRSLDQHHRSARATLAGGNAVARKTLTTARGAVDKQIDEIQKSLIAQFQELYDKKADHLEKATKDATNTIRSLETKNRVAQQYSGLEDRVPEVRDAEKEGQQAAAPRLLDNLASGIDKTSADQVKALHKAVTTPQQDGLTIEGMVKKFAQSLKESAVGGGETSAAKDTAAASPAAPTAKGKGEKKQEPLFDQADHAVRSAFSQAWHGLEEHVKSAREAILHARVSGLQQCSAQRAAVLQQITSIRRAHVEAIQSALRSGLKSVEQGTRSSLPSYSDASRRAGRSLEEAAAKGATPLLQMAREGLAGATRSINDGRGYQTRRLEQVAEGSAATFNRQPDFAADAAGKTVAGFETDLNTLTVTLARDMASAAEQSSQGVDALAKSVTATAHSYVGQWQSISKKAVDKQEKTWFPKEDDKSQKQPTPPPAKPEPQQKQASEQKGLPDPKALEKNYYQVAQNPKSQIDDPEHALGAKIMQDLHDRSGRIVRALGGFRPGTSTILTALRGITAKQGIAISVLYEKEKGESLAGRFREEYDRLVFGFDKNEYLAAMNALRGNVVASALYELKTTEGIFSSDGKRAEEIMRGLTAKERAALEARPDWPKVSADVKDGLSGTDLDVFNALADNQFKRADAIRFKEKADEAREKNDMDSLFKSMEQYRPGISEREEDPSQFYSYADMQLEFAQLKGVGKPGDTVTKDNAAQIFAGYITRDVTVQVPVGGEGDTMPVTYKVGGADKVLAETLAIQGPGSKDAKAARILREAERKDGKPDLEALENAVVDPRLNPALNQKLTPEERKKILAEQDQVFLAYLAMAKQYATTEANIPETAQLSGIGATDAKQARQFAARQLQSHYDSDAEKGRVGATYVASIVQDEVPDTVAGLRYAILGVGTDEGLVHRSLQRMSKKDVEDARFYYKLRYDDDLDEDLGTYGKSHFGDLSGDERLQAEREMLGVPQNDKERVELAIYTSLQQQKEAGVVGAAYNSGSAQERAMLENQKQLIAAAGGMLVIDDMGRPTIVGGHFDSSGKYTGKDIDRVLSDADFAKVTSENYAARIDELASIVTTAIAIIGAIAAAVVTVVTAGAASPLLMAAIAGVAGAMAIGANELIRGGRYGWEEAAKDLGMTAVQMISAGVGQSLTLAARGGSAAVAAGMRTLVVKELPSEMTRLAGSQFANTVLIGAATGGISGFGGALLDEHTWDKGISDGIGKAFLGLMKGSFSGAVTSAVTSKLDQTSIGTKLQGLSAEGGILAGGANVLARGLGKSAISAAGAVAGRGTELAFDSATGKFHGGLNEALASLGEAGREAALRGLFEGAGEAGGKRIENRLAAKAAKAHTEEARRQAVATAVNEEIAKSPTPFEEGVRLPEVRPATAVAAAEPQAHAVVPEVEGRRTVPAPTAVPPEPEPAGAARRQALALEDTTAMQPGVTAHEEAEPTRLAAEAQDSEAARRAAVVREAEPAAEDPGRKLRIDEQAAAGIAGARATGDAAERFGMTGTSGAHVDKVIDSLVGPEGAVSRYAKRLTPDGGGFAVELETRRTDANGDPVKVKVRVELVDSLPREGPNGPMPMAMYKPEGADGYLVRVSKGTPAEAVERALAHELTEIRAGHGQWKVEQKNALEPRSETKHLSPHDEGRLAELAVLAKQFSEATATGGQRNRALDEAQRLAAHLGLTGEGVAAVGRRALAFQELGEGIPQALLRAAIAGAEDNPFLQPLTGNLRGDLATLQSRLQMATELASDMAVGSAAFAAHTAEQIRQMLIRHEVVELREEQFGVLHPEESEPTRRALALSFRKGLSPEMQDLFDLALKQITGVLGRDLRIAESDLDPATLTATRAKFGDFENFEEWPEFKRRYLEKNPTVRSKSYENQFEDPAALRRLFDRWAQGQFLPKGSKYPRSLLSEDAGPDKGFEAQFIKNPEEMQGLALAKMLTLGEGDKASTIPLDEAIEKRDTLLNSAKAKRREALQAEIQGDYERTKLLRAQAQDFTNQVKPLSEAFGVLAGRAFVERQFGAVKIHEFRGSGVPDLLVELPDGRLVVVECKGGDAGLGTRLSANKTRVVEQGTREYLKAVATDMINSGEAKQVALGAKLLEQVENHSFQQEYYLVKQPFHNSQPLPPEVGQFDTTNRQTRTGTDSPPGASGVEEE